MTALKDGHYCEADLVGEQELAILGTAPKRWGRMDQVSRLAVVEVGRTLREADLLDRRNRLSEKISLGLIAGTRRGCLATDLAFCQSLAQGPAMASPLLFGYTLANTALAEAAVHYGIKGPVYALYSESPLAAAVVEAERWLEDPNGCQLMMAGALDYQPAHSDSRAQIDATFKIIGR